MSLTSGLDDIAVLSVTRQGVALARRLEASLPAKLTVYVTAKYAEGAPEHYVRFQDKLQPIVDAAWGKHEALIFIGAAGIAVRMIAPHVIDKRFDPGVVVMDIQGRFAIALCSGHLGGANELARLIGDAVGAIPVITTGTDVNETLAPDVLAKQIGADVENWDALKVVSGALVDSRRVGVLTDVSLTDIAKYAAKNVHVTDTLDGFDAGIGVTHRVIHTDTPTIWLRPKVLVVGIGCNSGTTEAEIAQEVDAVLGEAGLSPRSVRALATITLKQDEPGLVAFARARGVPLLAVDARTINEEAPPFARSEAVFRHVGVYGVSEPAAMLAAGAQRCLVTKQKRGNVTVAVALVPR
ncbi:MAG: cobalt-precorrin 5A hydrolase [Pseudomonadota bacterium]|nr:cobalt-precorrin 5A hydrolase [Pseudomonadota bacterium]